MPVFYRDVMYREGAEGKEEAYLKLYDGHDWKWFRVRLNHSLCIFQTGKRYNCDLSASYNTGARYFIRELIKPLPATERSLLEAKVPSVKRRTSCIYADLRELHLQMEALKTA
ncbi:MAG: transposase [Eubacteriales bacterium]|nr:transposase [Eubacteriales bacterium]